MARIKVNIDELKNSIAAMNQSIGQLESLNGRLESLIARIESSWEGDASVSYAATMRGRLSKAKEMISALVAFRSYMQSAVVKFQEKDMQNASQIRGC